MNQQIEIKGVKGSLTHFLIEEYIPHQSEYYLSIASKREFTEIHFSLSGGIQVEENWEKMKTL